MTKYKVVVKQRSVFYEEAATAQEAHLIVLEDRICNNRQSEEDTYDFEITVKEEEDS
jgi:DICT domain-containing protein